MWGASKELTEVMRKPAKDSDIMWDTVELLMPGVQLTVWSRDEGMPFPNLNEEPDFDDLYPESDVTNSFGKICTIGSKPGGVTPEKSTRNILA
jgi:hypothetical protein